MKKLGIQLYSVRDMIKSDYLGTLKKIVDFGYQVVEPAGYPGSNAKQAKQWFDELGLVVESIHSGLPVGDGRERVLDEAETVGCSTIISGFGPDDFKTVDGVKRKCAILNEAAQEAKKAGRQVGYHNHWWEFLTVENSGKTGYDFLVEECGNDVVFELDTYWAKVGGADPVAVIKRLGKRCPFLHVKDGAGEKNKPNVVIGGGVMEWPGIFNAAKHCGTVFVEFDSCATDILEAVAKSAQYLREKGLIYGR